MVMRVGGAYTERHSRFTIVTCLLMLIIVAGSGYYIYNYALNNHDDEVVITELDISIELYAPATNLTGEVRILYANGTIFLTLAVNEEGFVADSITHLLGDYKLYYEGIDNAINFGPITYTVAAQDSLLVDRDYLGVRVSIMSI